MRNFHHGDIVCCLLGDTVNYFHFVGDEVATNKDLGTVFVGMACGRGNE